MKCTSCGVTHFEAVTWYWLGNWGGFLHCVDDSMPMSLQTKILAASFSLVFATNLIGNGLVVVVILKDRRLRKTMNLLLLNLAVADILVAVFFGPGFLPMPEHPTGVSGDFLCKIVTGKNLGWLSSVVSAFTLVLVSIERFFAVVYPFNVRWKISKTKLRFIVPGMWLLATILTLPSFIADRFEKESSVCIEKSTYPWKLVYAVAWAVLAGFLPVVIMVVLYSIVIYTLWFKNNLGNAVRSAVRKSRKNASRAVIIVSVIYAVLCLPTHVLYCVYALRPNLFKNGEISFPITYILVVLNSSVNPFVYIFQCARFRNALRKLFCCEEE